MKIPYPFIQKLHIFSQGTLFFYQLPRGHLKVADGISFCAYNKEESYGTLNCTIKMLHIFGICYTFFHYLRRVHLENVVLIILDDDRNFLVKLQISVYGIPQNISAFFGTNYALVWCKLRLLLITNNFVTKFFLGGYAASPVFAMKYSRFFRQRFDL